MTPITQRALDIIITQIGQEEKPRGSNWGHPVIDYLASVGIHFPAAWCASLMYWGFNQAAGQLGTANPLFKTGGVLALWNNDKEKYGINRIVVSAGDLFVMDFGGGLGHIGIIESISGKVFNTIEGNTNIDGSREGYAVERKGRAFDHPKIIGILRY